MMDVEERDDKVRRHIWLGCNLLVGRNRFEEVEESKPLLKECLEIVRQWAMVVDDFDIGPFGGNRVGAGIFLDEPSDLFAGFVL